MAEQLPIGIHPGWWIAASVVCGVVGYLLMAGFTFRIFCRLGAFSLGDPFLDLVALTCVAVWPITLTCLAGYYWAKACEPKESKEKPCKDD